jgi:hypothetical protein
VVASHDDPGIRSTSARNFTRVHREGVMNWLHIILMLAGGLLGISGLVVAKKPDAKKLIDQLVPFQAFIGVGLLAIGLVRWFQFGIINIFKGLSAFPVLAFTGLAAVFGSIILGFLFGMPQIAKWIPGQSGAENKAMEFSKKIAPYQLIIGLVVLGAGLLALLFQLGILKPM